MFFFRRRAKSFVWNCICTNMYKRTPNTGITRTGTIQAILKLELMGSLKI